MIVVIEIVGDGITDRPAYVRSYTPHGFDGRGHVVLTQDLRRAWQFASTAAAFKAYHATSATHPTRTDGRPNRPLTAYDVWMHTLPDSMFDAPPHTDDRRH